MNYLFFLIYQIASRKYFKAVKTKIGKEQNSCIKYSKKPKKYNEIQAGNKLFGVSPHHLNVGRLYQLLVPGIKNGCFIK
jgi:hypothetical protein